MKYYINIFLFFLSISLSSCSDNIEEDFINPVENTIGRAEINDEGFLTFASFNDFENFINKIERGETPNIMPNSRGGKFTSLYELDRKQLSRADDNDPCSELELSELEEMTEEEYSLMKAEKLIFDNILTHALDTTLRICVENKLYKITEYGTFSIDVDRSDELDSIIENFDPILIQDVPTGETVNLNNDDLTFTNSFGENETGTILTPETSLIGGPAPGFSPTPTTPNLPEVNTFHYPYNTNTYSWRNSGIIKRFLDKIRGKDVSKSNNFSKNYRVQVNVFDVNYLFYKSAGIKVKMQKRKKFLFVPYWVTTPADKIVVGFNNLEGELTYNNPNNLSSITPTASAKWSLATGTINNILTNYLYGTFVNLKFIRDWTDWAFGWMPEIRIGDQNYTDQVMNKIYNMEKKFIYGQTKKLINKKVFTPLGEKYIKPTDPMVAYLVWGSSSYTFTKERPFITGVKEYINLNSKSVIFDRSFGVAFIGCIPAPYTPSDFDIKKIDVFGAAFYEGQWKGIRFIHE